MLSTLLPHVGDKVAARAGFESLVRELEAPQPRVSDHLRCLSSCGYVQVRREGRNAYYSVTDERIMTILGLGEELLRDNQGHLLACVLGLEVGIGRQFQRHAGEVLRHIAHGEAAQHQDVGNFQMAGGRDEARNLRFEGLCPRARIGLAHPAVVDPSGPSLF